MIKVFGITGTNGKTSASCMLRSILQEEGNECGLIGTVGYWTGKQEYSPVNTTPGKERLKMLFQEMEEKNVKQCVMEVSSHGIHQGRIEEIEIAYAGFTNLSRDHLDYHKTMEHYYQTKKSLFLQCKKGVMINMDDAYGKRLLAELKEEVDKPEIKGYSLKEAKAGYYGNIIEEGLEGSRFLLYEEGCLLGELKISIPGRHFVSNAVLAAALARRAGVSFPAIRRGLQYMEPVPGRMERIGSDKDTLGIVDYAHTPDGMEKLLTTLSGFKRGKLLCVFGCGGFRDKGKRFLMGETAGTYSDYAIITNDNPRGEPPENICQDIEEGLRPTGCSYQIIFDRYQAIKRAVSLADKWDIIVVAGKGHETYQLSGDQKIPFDDRAVLKELLEKKYEKNYDETN